MNTSDYFDSSLEYPVKSRPEWNIQDSSKLKTMMECPRKYFYEYVLGWRPVGTNQDIAFGSAIHKALEVIYIENTFDQDSVLRAHEAFMKEYRRFIDPGDDEIYERKSPKRALIALAYYVSQYAEDKDKYSIVEHDGKQMVEIGGSISISSDHIMQFRMDTILKDEFGYLSMDHKTASSNFGMNQYELAVQTAVYHHVLCCLYPPEQVRGIKYNIIIFKATKDNLKKDHEDPFRHFELMRVPIYKTPEQLSALLNNIIWWLDMVQYEFDNLYQSRETDPVMYAFPMNPTSCTNYRGCPYLDFCISWPNPLKRCKAVPIGFKEEHWNPLAEPPKVEVNR